MWDRGRTIKALKAYSVYGRRTLRAAKDAAAAYGRDFTERGDDMTTRVEVLASLLGATLLAHPEGHGQPYWRRGELTEAIKEVRKDAGYFISSQGRPPKYKHPEVEWGEMCIIRQTKGKEFTGQFAAWNPRTNTTTIRDEGGEARKGVFLMQA